MNARLDEDSAHPSPLAKKRSPRLEASRAPWRRRQSTESGHPLAAVVAQIRGVSNWGVQRGKQARLLERGSSFNEESGK